MISITCFAILIAGAMAQPPPGGPPPGGPPPGAAGGIGGPPLGGYGPGMGPGGASRPRPPPHGPQSGGPPGAMQGQNGGQTPATMTFTVGKLASTDSLGSFNLYMFDNKAPAGSTDFQNMAMGGAPPKTSDGSLNSHTGGFVGLSMDTIFPQFVTCTNSTATTIAQYAATAGGKVQGTFSTSDNTISQSALFGADKGSGVLFVVQPGNYYYLATSDAELSGLTGSRPIGYITSSDMTFLTGVRKYVCNDYETVYGTSTGRRKRAADSFGITACAVK